MSAKITFQGDLAHLSPQEFINTLVWTFGPFVALAVTDIMDDVTRYPATGIPWAHVAKSVPWIMVAGAIGWWKDFQSKHAHPPEEPASWGDFFNGLLWAAVAGLIPSIADTFDADSFNEAGFAITSIDWRHTGQQAATGMTLGIGGYIKRMASAYKPVAPPPKPELPFDLERAHTEAQQAMEGQPPANPPQT